MPKSLPKNVNAAKQVIDGGELGKLTVFSFHYMIYKEDKYFDVEWHRKKGAGPILVNLVHDVDLLRYLIGEVDAVQALSSSSARGFETEDSAVVNVHFKSGALASMTLSDTNASPWNWKQLHVRMDNINHLMRMPILSVVPKVLFLYLVFITFPMMEVLLGINL